MRAYELVEAWERDAAEADRLAKEEPAWQNPRAQRNLQIAADTLRQCASALRAALEADGNAD